MPKTDSIFARTTPFPNLLLDDVMRLLSDTAWRVLCVLVRQTNGWHKREDWLSHSRLKRQTGRESAAVSRAVDTLVKRGLIIVRNRSHHRLNSTAERRRSRSGLVFSIHPLLLISSDYRRRIGLELHNPNFAKRKQQKTNLQNKTTTPRQGTRNIRQSERKRDGTAVPLLRGFNNNTPALRNHVPNDVEEQKRLTLEVFQNEDGWSGGPNMQGFNDLRKFSLYFLHDFNRNRLHEENLTRGKSFGKFYP